MSTMLTTMQAYADKQGWNENTQIALCFDYLDTLVSRGVISPTGFGLFLADRQSQEDAPTITAQAHTDDRVCEITFDALPWFEAASDEEITDLIGCGFGGDEPADRIAMFEDERNEDVAAMFAYLERHPRSGNGDAIGFEVHVDETEARAWIAANRPHLLPAEDAEETTSQSTGLPRIGSDAVGVARFGQAIEQAPVLS